MSAGVKILGVAAIVASGLAVAQVSRRQGGDLAPPAYAQTDALPPLDLTGMRLWNYSAKYHASEWDNGLSPVPWSASRVRAGNAGQVTFVIDAAAAPELQAAQGTAAQREGLWEADVQLPQLRPGLIVAPLWLYDKASKDEIDFEWVGTKGLQLTLHAYPGGVHQQHAVMVFQGSDMSGQRVRLGIRVDQAAGTIAMIVNGATVHTFTRENSPFWVDHAFKPMFSMFPVKPTSPNLVSWAGVWTPLAAGEQLTMINYGYRYAPL